MEQTFGMIKPNAMKKNLIGKIFSMIEEEGFTIKKARLETLTSDQAKKFYEEHAQRPFFGSLVQFITSGPVFLFVLEAENAVERWRKLMGATDPAKAAPHTIRKLYGDNVEANSVHGSDSLISSKREIGFFFS